VLGAIYWYSGSLLTAMAAHFFYDAFMIVLVYLNPEMLKNMDATIIQQSNLQLFVSGMVSLAITVLIIWQMKKKSQTSYEEVYKTDALIE
jgi:uncharacterized protein YjeT (DUF2065 family)